MNLKFINISLQRIALLHKDCAKTDVSQVAIDNQRVTFSSTSQIIFLNYRFALSKFLYMVIHHTCSCTTLIMNKIIRNDYCITWNSMNITVTYEKP